MNQPDRYERFMLPEGKKKAEYQEDTQLQNTGAYEIQREDHTLGNLVRMHLLGNPAVVFAGYRIPHPLVPVMVTRIQTDGSQTPEDAMIGSLRTLNAQVRDMEGKVQSELVQLNRAGPRDMSCFNRQQDVAGRRPAEYDQGYSHQGYRPQPQGGGYPAAGGYPAGGGYGH